MKQLITDFKTFLNAWKIASVKITDEVIARYRPEARHLIVYAQVRKAMVDAGKDSDEITGSMVHAAIALAYYFRHFKKS